MYYDKQTIEYLRNVSIIKVLEHFGITTDKNTISCIFSGHNDLNPSFHISEDKNIAKCYGCGRGGNPIQFIMDYLSLNFYQSLCYIQENIITTDIKDSFLKLKYINYLIFTLRVKNYYQSI